MAVPNKFRIVFKAISSLTAGIFLWNQVAWAGDLINTALEQQYKEQSQTFAPAYLQNQQSSAEILVGQKQAIEDIISTQNLMTSADTQAPADETLDLRGPIGGSDGQTAADNAAMQTIVQESTASSQDSGAVLSVTTQAGDVIHYKDSLIDYIEKKDGAVLRNLTLDENNNLLGAEITYPDGTIQTVANGKVSRVIKPDGAILNYNEEELISSIVYPDGQTADCSYTKDGQGNIIETILTDSEKTSRYDSNNRLTKVEFNTGKTIEYSSGIISKITESDNSAFVFDIKTSADNTITSSLSLYTAPNGTIYRYTLSESNALTSITVEKNGIVGTYNKDGALVSVTKDGQSVSSEIIAQTQADYDDAFAIYQRKELETQSCQAILNDANTDLANKTAAKDAVQATLNAAMQDLTNAQLVKDTRQAGFTNAYNDYAEAQAVYDSALSAFNIAKALETQTQQNLTAAQAALSAKQTTLNNKIAARQAMQAAVASLNNELQQDQTALAQAQQGLTRALAEEQTAQTDYNNAQADVTSKQTAYNNAVADRQAREAVLTTANTNLTAKTTAKDQAYATLQTAIQNLNSAQTTKDAAQTAVNTAVQNLTVAQANKDAKQALYDTAYNDYLTAQSAYNAANTALNTAKATETQTQQNLTAAQANLATKQTVLNSKIAARQAIQTTIANLNTEIQSDQTALTQAQANLTVALAEEQAAQTDYNNAQADVTAKQTAYNNAVTDRQAKELVLATANTNLVNAQQAKAVAENALSIGSPYIVSSYTATNGVTTLNQYKNFINDQFDTYNSSLWYKPADTLVTIGSGSAILKGTGSNYNATFYGKQSYSILDRPTFTTTFKVSSTSGRFIAAMDGYTASNRYRRVGVYVYSGRIYLQTTTGSTSSNKATLISTAKANTNYTVQFEVTQDAINVYLWESTAQKPTSSSYVYTTTDWSAVRPYYSLYSGTATVDSATMKGPDYSSTYDASGNVIKDIYQNGNTSVYSYSQNTITVYDYREYLDTPYTLSTTGLWYKPADSLVTINNGVATLKGTGSNYNATFYANQVFQRADNVDLKSTFQATSTSGKFIAAVDGYTSSNAYRRVGIVMQSGRIYLQTMSGTNTGTPKTLISIAKANTNYNVEFEVTSASIKIYLWESSAQRPTSPSYTYAVTDWTTARPYFSVYSGQAIVSNAYINYISQVRTISSGSSEYSQILARNQLVKNLNNAIVAVNTAQLVCNAANTALDNAKTIEFQIQRSFADAQATLTTKQTTLNIKTAARQAIHTTIAKLNNEIQSYQTALAQAQQGLTRALAEEQTAQTEYNNAQADLNAKQAAYNSAVQDKQAKEAAFNTANAGLTTKTSAKNQADTALQAAIQALTSAQTTKDAAQTSLNSAAQALNNAQSVKDTKQTAYTNAYDDYVAAKTAYDSANTTLNNAKALETTTSQALTTAQNTFNAKQATLNNKIAARQAMQAAIASLNNKLQQDQTALAQAQQGLTRALAEEQTAQTDYNNAQADVTSKQTAYNNAVQDRQTKEASLTTATADLTAKTIAKDQANTDLQTAIQNFSSAQIVKDTAQVTYNSASADYESAQTVYSRTLTNFNNAKSAEDAAKTQADLLLAALDTLLSASLMFPQQDMILQNVNSKFEAVRIIYDSEKRVKQISEMDGDIQVDTDSNGLIDNITNSLGTTLYSYDLSRLDNINEMTVNRDGIKRIYDKYGDIKSISLSDATQIVYENGHVKEIVKADGTKIKNMTFTGTGDLDSALISYPDGSVAVYRDAKLLQIINQSGSTVYYKDGKIRQITLDDGATYDWSYEGGNIVILDNSQQEKRTYLQGKLIKVEQLIGSKLITNYYYDNTSNNLAKTEVCQIGEILYTYTYTYANNLTLIHDEDGNIQAYTNDKKLSYIIDSTGKKYSYTYIGQNEGYVEVSYPSGAKVKYDMSGNIIEIKESDGMIIKEITLDQNKSPINFTYIKDNTTYKIIDGKISEVISEDGADTLYYNNGFIKSMQGQIANSLEEYQYYVADAKTYKDASFFQSGTPTNVSYYINNNNATLQLSSNTLRFGTGLDGVKHITANETLTAGTYNYTSLTIDAGKTLTLAPGTVIKCLGIVTINGKVSGSSLTISAYVIDIGSSASFSGTGQCFKANTINNSIPATNITTEVGNQGSAGQAYDNDESTWIGNNYGHGGGDFGFDGHDSVTYNFASPTDISEFYYHTYATAGAGGQYGSSYSGWFIDIVSQAMYGDANWHTLWSGGGDSGPVTCAGLWTGITNARAYSYAGCHGDSGGNAQDRIYEFRVSVPITYEYVNGTGNLPPSAAPQSPYPLSGTFESNVIELNALELDNISWNQEIPIGAEVKFQTRTGNTTTPDDTWSDWSSPMSDPNGSKLSSSSSKYIQYKITMTTTDSHATPSLNLSDSSLLTLGYKRAPVDSIELMSLSYITLKKNDVTYAYNKSGLLIWTKAANGAVTPYDPPDSTNIIDPAKLIFNSVGLSSVRDAIPTYILNNTQKEIYLRENVIESELTAVTGADGSIAEYSNGQIIKITRQDGTTIKDITFDANNNAKSFTYIKNNTTYIVKDGAISEVLTSAGDNIKYYSCGAIESAENGPIRKDYLYNMPTSVSYTTQSVFQNGSLNNANYFQDGNKVYLELTRLLPDFGNGFDGDLRVEAGQMIVIDGTKNYKSIYVAPGATLTASPWNGSTGGEIQIKCQGSVDIDGTLETNAKGYRGGYGINSGRACRGIQGESYAGSQGVSKSNNYGGGGGSWATASTFYQILATSGGGSYGTNGTNGNDYKMPPLYQYMDSLGGSAGTTYGDQYLTTLYRGSGGGGFSNYNGGNGGGIIKLVAPQINISGKLSADGGDGTVVSGGGSGGSILLIGGDVSISGNVSAKGGQGGVYAYDGATTIYGGNGGDGRIRIDYVTLTGNISAQAYTQQFPYVSSGTFQSEVIELDAHQLGNISWGEELPAGTQVTLQTRTGNASTPDGSWSNWSGSLADSNGSQITSPVGMYIQYRATLSTQNTAVSPRLVLTDNKGLSISFIRSPLTPAEFNNITSLNVIQNGATLTYDQNGLNVTNPQDTIDVSSLVFNSTYLNTIRDELPTYKLGDAQKIITIYNQGNNAPTEIINADQTITHFENGYPARIVDKNGTLEVQYAYDANNNVISVELINARQKLIASYNQAVSQIVTQKDAALAKLVAAEADSRANIAAQSANIQQQIDNERQKLTRQKAQYDPNVYDLSAFNQAFAQLDDYQTQLNQQIQDAYTNLASQVADAQARINADASTAMQNLINNDYNVVLGNIAQKESSPIIYQYYRSVLGRDPGDSELLYWMTKAKTDLAPINPTTITQYIQSLPEYSDRQTRKQNIINNLTSFFTQYLSASDSSKQAMLLSLGLTLSDAVSLTQDDICNITSWLNGKSLHFGDSAFNTVITMLKNAGINKSFEDIGKDAIKIDILAGVITKATTGDLVISLYAMRKVAAINGLSSYSEKITYNDLKDQVSRGNVIIHIDGKHYVLVTSIDDIKGTITYTDTTVGSSGQSMTISRNDLMNIWKGYSLAKELISDPAKQINATKEKNIRGSSWWSNFWKAVVNFFQKIVAPIAAILLFITPLAPLGAIALGINIIIQTISFVVHTGSLMDVVWSVINTIGAAIGTLVLKSVYTAVGPIFDQISHFIPASISGAFQSVMPIFNAITDTVRNIATGIGSIFNATIADSLMNVLTTRVISTGIQLGTDFLFKSIHLDPTLSHLGSALLAGAIIGVITPDTNVVAEALKFGTIAGVEELGEAADLDPNITHLSAMMAGSLVGGALNIDGKQLTYDQLMKDIAPNIISEAGYIGITDIGELLGVDPRISYLAGIGIRSSINPGVDQFGNPRDMWQGITDGLLQGVTNIGLNYATQEMGLDPLLANIGFSAISAALNAGIQVATGRSDNFFASIFETYEKNALTFLGYTEPGMPVSPWQQAAYISQILDFSNIVQKRGLVEALNTYGAGFFNAVAVNQIVQLSTTIGKYFDDKLKAGQYTLKTVKGKEVAAVDTPTQSDGGKTTALFERVVGDDGTPYWNPVGKEENSGNGRFSWSMGEIGADAYGKLGYTEADLYSIFNSDTQYQRIENGQQAYVEIKDSNNKTLLAIEPTENGHYNVYDSYGDYVDAQVDSNLNGYKITLKDSEIQKLYNTSHITLDELSKETLATFGIHYVNELGTLYYYLTNENSKISFSALNFEWNDDVKNILHENPYLLPYIVDLASKNFSGDTQLFNAFFDAVDYNSITTGTIVRENKGNADYIVNYFKDSKPLTNTAVIMVPGTDFGKIVADDITGDTQYPSRTQNWADNSYVRKYLQDLGADVTSFVWNGNTTLAMDAAATNLADTIASLKNSGKEVIVIGHSAGDWVARKAFESLGTNYDVKAYIGLGSPETNKNITIPSNVHEWYNITSENDIVTAMSRSSQLINAQQIRFRDLTHTEYFGNYNSGDIGASGNIIKLLLKDRYDEILRNR